MIRLEDLLNKINRFRMKEGRKLINYSKLRSDIINYNKSMGTLRMKQVEYDAVLDDFILNPSEEKAFASRYSAVIHSIEEEGDRK